VYIIISNGYFLCIKFECVWYLWKFIFSVLHIIFFKKKKPTYNICEMRVKILFQLVVFFFFYFWSVVIIIILFNRYHYYLCLLVTCSLHWPSRYISDICCSSAKCLRRRNKHCHLVYILSTLSLFRDRKTSRHGISHQELNIFPQLLLLLL
jgi:hypothetical protein